MMSSTSRRPRFFPTLIRRGLPAAGCALCLLAPASPAATHLTTVHPGYTLTSLRPGNFQPDVGGMAFLSDGRLVVGTWGGLRTTCCPGNTPIVANGRQYTGTVYVLSGAVGATSAEAVSVDTIATGLEDLMGLTVVDDVIYVSGGNRILRLNRAGNSGPVTSVDTVFILPGTPRSSGPEAGDSLRPVKGRSEWLYGLLHRDGRFYLNPSSMVNGNIQQANPFRGRMLEVTPGDGISDKRGSFRTIATGFRHHTGLAFGADGTIWTSETQGNYVPTNKLIAVKEGAHYGYRHGSIDADLAWNDLPETPAAVFLPQEGSGGSGNRNSTGIFSNSPGAPLVLTQGIYAGQVIMGDVTWGGIQRFFVEKVAGEYQGAGFAWMGGLEGGPYRLLEDASGSIYAGMIGTTGDWSWNGQFYGLQKLTPNGTITFEMLAVRSRAEGMEIEFTLPVDTALAKQASSYNILTYAYNPTAAYGGRKMEGTLATLTPSSIRISSDRRRVYLALPGLVARTTAGATPGFGTHRIVELNITGSYRSETGATPRDTAAFYTLNAISSSAPFSDSSMVSVQSGVAVARAATLAWKVAGDRIMVTTPFHGAYTARLLDVRGVVLATTGGRGAEAVSLAADAVRGCVAILEARGDGRVLRKAIALP